MFEIAIPNIQRPLEDVSKTLIVWRHHKDVLETFNWKMLKTLYRRLQILWLEVEIKTLWRRRVFNLENTFWTPIKHFNLSHLKALWRRFEGSISNGFEHTVQTSSGRITWGRGEDILQTGVFLNLKTIYERVKNFQREQIEGVMGAFWRLLFQMVSRHLANVFISYDLALRYRRSGDGNFLNLKYAF